jgi:hypothetical protein
MLNSACRPSETAASFFYDGERTLKDVKAVPPWIPSPWSEAEFIAAAAKGTPNQLHEDHLGFVPFERLRAGFLTEAELARDLVPFGQQRAALSADAANARTPGHALRLAYHRAFFRVNYAPHDRLALDGIERRPYLLRAIDHVNYSGALSGMVLVRPRRDGDRLTLHIKVDQAAYYDVQGSGIGAGIATGGSRAGWKHHKYVEKDGRLLLDKLVLRRHGKEIPLTEQPPRDDGWFVFDAGSVPEGFAGLTLAIDVALFDDRRTLFYDLFASAAARGLEARP